MLKGKTQSGFNYEVTDETLNNFELIEILAEVDANPLLMAKLLPLLLGEDGAAALKEHVRTENGIIPTDAISDEIMEIFQSGVNAKNS